MNDKNHHIHIARHLREVSRSVLCSPEQLKQILIISQLDFDGSQAMRNGGLPIMDRDCAKYREAVRTVLGEVTYMLVKANFTLAGCNCN